MPLPTTHFGLQLPLLACAFAVFSLQAAEGQRASAHVGSAQNQTFRRESGYWERH